MGSPEFSVPTLEALLGDKRCEVCAVVTQPDKKSGRGQAMLSPAVKICAQAHNVPCYQPEKLASDEMFETLSAIAPDFFVTIAYGKILRQRFLDIPKMAPLNLHASLLPNLRGAAPIQWAVIRGAKTSGVCLMKMDRGMDTGPVYARREVALDVRETSGSLHDKLSQVSAELLMAHLFEIYDGQLQAHEQVGEPNLAPMLEKSMGMISFDGDAQTLDALCRGLNPWPMAVAQLNGRRVSLAMTQALDTAHDAAPGTVLGLDAETQSLLIACGQGVLAVESLQPEGKKRMDAASFYHGYRPQGLVFRSL